MALPADYEERVYAGVLGKIIGVYLGRPFEGRSYEQIMAELGEIWYYVHDRTDVPLRTHQLVITDDDISGTFTFLRALPDYGNTIDLTPQQIGQTWLNYIIERRTILWWGGMGNSTEHTAYLRLKNGIAAPASGSIAANGKVVAEQIGAQIFIDGWAMVAPGDPELAADLARRAASVSHDGEAIYGAQVVAAMESLAFIERDLDRLLDAAVALIPMDSVIFRMIEDIRSWHAEEKDWRRCRESVERTYGYDSYGGNCHIIPNHALIILALLYGGDDFQKSLMIVNTCGWDTDCNSGNVGCLLGIKNGLAGIDAGPDWRGPIADRMYVSSADGGSSITDALSEAYKIANIGRALTGEPPSRPKNGARFHFELPGSLQGFQGGGAAFAVENVAGGSTLGNRSLALRYRHLAPAQVAFASTPTFIPPKAEAGAYHLFASPTLYPGQTVRARAVADRGNSETITCRLFISKYDTDDELSRVPGPAARLSAGVAHDFEWRIDDLDGQPVAEIGLEVTSDRATAGTVYLDYLTWSGSPTVQLGRPAEVGTGIMWRRAWVAGVDRSDPFWPEPHRLIQNTGTGLLIQGTRDWDDYRLEATITPHLAASFGIGVRVQGMRRYYALLLYRDGDARLVEELDGTTVLAEKAFTWDFGRSYELSLEVCGSRLQAAVDGTELFAVEVEGQRLSSGAVALICEEGRVACDSVTVRSV